MLNLFQSAFMVSVGVFHLSSHIGTTGLVVHESVLSVDYQLTPNE
jgi:hypothetical protein